MSEVGSSSLDVTSTGPVGRIPYGEGWRKRLEDFNIFSDVQLVGHISARRSGQGEVKLSWVFPSDPSSWDRYVVLRSFLGTPENRWDGLALVNNPSNASLTSLTDSGIPGARWAHYALFVRTTDASQRWVRSATASVVVIEDKQGVDKVQQMVPEFILEEDAALLDYPPGQTPLALLLQNLGVQFDGLRSEVDALSKVRDIANMPTPLLSELANQLGWPRTVRIGEARLRSVLNNLMRWRRSKGTTDSISWLVSAILGLDAVALPSKNAAPSVASSSFENVGEASLLTHHWVSVDDGDNDVSVTKLTSVVAGSTIPGGNGNAIAPFVGLASAYYLPDADGSLHVASWPMDDALESPAPDHPSVRYGWPAEVGTLYCFSTYLMTDDPSGTSEWGVEVEFYDEGGKIGVATGSTNAVAWDSYGEQKYGESLSAANDTVVSSGIGTLVGGVSNWGDVRPYIAFMTPVGTKYLRFLVTEGTASSPTVLYLDGTQLEIGTETPTIYEKPHLTTVHLDPLRRNLAANPNFSTDTDHWWETGNVTLTRPTVSPVSGTNHLRVDIDPNSGSNEFVGTYFLHEELDLASYTVSAFVRSSSAASMEITIMLVWYDAAGVDIGHVVSTQTANDSTWNRLTATSGAPVGAVRGEVLLGAPAGPDPAVFDVDAVLIEPFSHVARTYFDGGSNSLLNEYSWQGVGEESQSFFFPSRSERDASVYDYAPTWLPLTGTILTDYGGLPELPYSVSAPGGSLHTTLGDFLTYYTDTGGNGSVDVPIGPGPYAIYPDLGIYPAPTLYPGS